MATSKFFAAVAAVAALACVVSAQPGPDLYGTAHGAPLFAAIGGADYTNDTALVGFRFTYFNATGTDVTESASGNIAMDARGMITSQFINPSGPCFSEGIEITLKDVEVFEWHEDDGMRSYTLSMLAEFTALGSRTMPELDSLNVMLHSCTGGLTDEPSERMMPVSAESMVYPFFRVMMVEARTFGVWDHTARSLPPRARVQAFSVLEVEEDKAGDIANAVMNSEILSVFFVTCLEDQLSMAADMDPARRRLDQDQFMRVNDLSFRWTQTDTDDVPAGMANFQFKAILDLPWESASHYSVDERFRAEFLPMLKFGTCLHSAMNATVEDHGVDKVVFESTIVWSSEESVTEESDEGATVAVFRNAASFESLMSENNFRLADFVFTNGLNSMLSEKSRNDGKSANPAMVLIQSVLPIGDDLVITVRANVGHADDDEDFFMEEGLTAALESGLTAATSGTEVDVGNIDEEDAEDINMYTFTTVDLVLEDQRRGDITPVGEYATRFKSAVGYVAAALTGAFPDESCAGCMMDRTLTEGNYTLYHDWAIDSAVLSPTTAVYRYAVHGHMDAVAAYVARLAGSSLLDDVTRDVLECSTGCEQVTLSLSRTTHFNAHVGEVHDNMLSTAESIVRVGGISFTTANSPEFRILAEYAADLALGEAGVPTFDMEGEDDWVNTHWQGCAYAGGVGVSDCIMVAASGNWAAIANNDLDGLMTAEEIGNATVRHLFAENQFRDSLRDLIMPAESGAQFDLTVHHSDNMEDTITSAVVFPGRPMVFPEEEMNAALPTAAALTIARYFGRAENADTWSLWGCTTMTTFTACQVSFVPEPTFEFMSDADVGSVVQGVFYTLSTDPIQVPDDDTPQEAFSNPVGNVVGPCVACGTTSSQSSANVFHGYLNSFRIFLTVAELANDPRQPNGNAILRLASTFALQAADIDVEFPRVGISDAPDNADHNGATGFSVSFRTFDDVATSGLRQRVNSDIAELFSDFALRDVGTGCLAHLFKYEVSDSTYLATDRCEVLYSDGECQDIRDNNSPDNRVVDNARGRNFYVRRDIEFDNLHLQECGCDSAYSCWS